MKKIKGKRDKPAPRTILDGKQTIGKDKTQGRKSNKKNVPGHFRKPGTCYKRDD